jgi:hypothetical protein
MKSTDSFKAKFLVLLMIHLFYPEIFLNAQNDSTIVQHVIHKTDLTGQWFLAYTYDVGKNENYFDLKRGYLTIESTLSSSISVRYTQDITLIKEGSEKGNIEFRLKYMYMKLKPFKEGVLKNVYSEIGMVHRPWIDFEDKVNFYRVQGPMFIDKNGIVGSADFGITIFGLIGGELDQTIQNRLGSHFPGKYGSFSFGIYNGAGYHDIEMNSNKVFDGRISVRPLPNLIPGFQLSYNVIYGKPNLEDHPVSFNSNLFFLSYESKYYTLTGQYYTGRGDSYGKYYSEEGAPNKNEGYSFFGEGCVPGTNFSILGRYDYFCSKNGSNYTTSGYYIGTAYKFLKNKLLLFYSQDSDGLFEDRLIEVALEIAF